MLSFLRKHAALIGGAIFFSFAATMFTGAFFFGGGSDLPSDSAMPGASQNRNLVATFGGTSIDNQKFIEFFSQSMERIAATQSGKLDPEIEELLRYSAFYQSLQFSIFLEAAKDSGTTIANNELKQGLETIYRQYDLKNLKELKKALKKNNYEYNDFLDNLKNELLVRQFSTNLRNQVSVTDKDVDDKYTELKVQHLLIRRKDDESLERTLTRLKEVQAKLESGMSFTQAVKTYSQDNTTENTNGIIGWIKQGNAYRSFEEKAYTLAVGELSEPVKTPLGYHIIKLLDKRKIKMPETLDLDKEKAEILGQKQSQLLQDFIQAYLVDHPLDINDPFVRAYKAKSEGDILAAIAAYQAQVSMLPSNPIPNYLLGKVYLMSGDKNNAKREFLRAEIKGEGNPQYDYPMIHIELGKLYKNERDKGKMNAAYDRAIEAADNKLQDLKRLAYVFKELNEPRRQKKIEQKISILETETKENTATANTAQG